MPSFTSKVYKSLKDRTLGYDGNIYARERKLPERSYLAIEFPQPKDRVIRAFIPFLENAIISEKGSAKLNTYDLVGRAGQLFSYGGANSRSLSVTFQITLAHLMELGKEMDDRFQQLFKVYFEDENNGREAFNLGKDAGSAAGYSFQADQLALGGNLDDGDYKKASEELVSRVSDEAYDNTYRNDLTVKNNYQNKNHSEIHRQYYKKLTEKLSPESNDPNWTSEAIRGFKNLFGLDGRTSQEKISEVNKVLDLFIFYINLIRASVLNNSRNTVYGPPILRLNHGSLYNNIPCLLRSYSISILEDAGYEVATLTPKRVSINLDLVESRVGNYGSFVAGDSINGDNLTGWESMIETSNMDPYNGVIQLGGNDFGVSFQKYQPPKGSP